MDGNYLPSELIQQTFLEPLYLVPSTTWECVWPAYEELELVRLSEFRKREKGKEAKGLEENGN